MRIIHFLVIGVLVFAAAYVYRIKMESTSRVERVLRLSDEEYGAFQRHSLEIVAPHDIETTITAFERLYRGEDIRDPETRVELAD